MGIIQRFDDGCTDSNILVLLPTIHVPGNDYEKIGNAFVRRHNIVLRTLGTEL